MLRSKAIVLFVLLSGTGVSLAQTGPVGPNSDPNGAPKTMPPAAVLPANGSLHPDRLAAYLTGQGLAIEKRQLQGGVVALFTTIKKDGWDFQVEFEYSADQKCLNLVCPLGNLSAQSSSAQLLNILKANYNTGAARFSYRESDHRLLLEMVVNTVVTENVFQSILDAHLKLVRQNYNVWNSQQAPMSGGPAPLSSGLSPAPSVTPQVTNAIPNAAQVLVNSIWKGNENVQGFGALEFHFLANGQVIMVDTAGRTMGTFTQQGSLITLTFHNGNVVYRGTRNGNSIAGQAGNKAGATWNFSVSI